MEQHPVPQNVTTFQFRLVGDMTIKQFGYLAGGIIVGYLCYKLPLPFIFTWPLAIGSGLLGFGLAFVPVEERPMDVWIASFFKNVYSPTQWVWQKEKRAQEPERAAKQPPAQPAAAPIVAPAPAPAPNSAHAGAAHHESFFAPLVDALASLTASLVPSRKPIPGAAKTATPHEARVPPAQKQPAPPPPPAALQRPPAAQLVMTVRHQTSVSEWLKNLFASKHKAEKPSLPPGFTFADALNAKGAAPPIQALTPSAPKPQPQPQPTAQPATPVPPTQPQPAPSAAHDRVVELQGQLSEMLAHREKLERELISMRERLEQQSKPAAQPPTRYATIVPAGPATPTASVRVIAPESAAKAGLPRLTSFPNVVTGIVKDSAGNLLAGLLVTVRDKDDTPQRALKTNRLGQFASSMPLPNGTYIVEIEDPKDGFVFDKAQIALTGSIAPLIEVNAKSQKQVERDKLAKEIFGNTQM